MRTVHLLRIVTIVLGLTAVGAAWSPAAACSCMARGPACQAFWTTTAVFDATVVAIEDLEVQFVLGDGVRRGRKLLVKLDVRQAWKGVRSGPLEVVTEPYDASCGFEFKVGRRYLVF